MAEGHPRWSGYVPDATGDASELLMGEMDALRVVGIMEQNTFLHSWCAMMWNESKLGWRGTDWLRRNNWMKNSSG